MNITQILRTIKNSAIKRQIPDKEILSAFRGFTKYHLPLAPIEDQRIDILGLIDEIDSLFMEIEMIAEEAGDYLDEIGIKDNE